ncbi:hypothetical protein Tco_0884733 [Tanacetum coccineum]
MWRGYGVTRMVYGARWKFVEVFMVVVLCRGYLRDKERGVASFWHGKMIQGCFKVPMGIKEVSHESEMKNVGSKSRAAKPPAGRHTFCQAADSPAGRLDGRWSWKLVWFTLLSLNCFPELVLYE